MYLTLLALHSLFRWIALIVLLLSTFIALRGYLAGMPFTTGHNSLRHWTATVLHIQLTIGFLLYFASPVISYYWHQPREERTLHDAGFFAVVHFAMMFIAVLVASFGSASAKRKRSDVEKFKTMTIFFAIALIIILLGIPWPFSPWTTRPLIRPF